MVICVQSPGSLVSTEGRWLTGCDIDNVQTLLRTHWDGDGLQSVTTVFSDAMQRPFIQVTIAGTEISLCGVMIDQAITCHDSHGNITNHAVCAVQVLFSPVRSHWVTVYGAKKTVTVFDSLHGPLSKQTMAVVRTLAGRTAAVRCSKKCTRQVALGDCGPFALAYATTVVLGGNLTFCGIIQLCIIFCSAKKLQLDEMRLRLCQIIMTTCYLWTRPLTQSHR